MIFADLPAGEAIFVDANTLVYHFQPHVIFGPACTSLLQRIELHQLSGFTSTHVVSEVVHRLMTLEACAVFGWPFAGIAQRLRMHPAEVRQLTRFRQAIQEVSQHGLTVLPIPVPLLDTGAAISQQTGLLTNDALIVAVMQQHGLTNLACHDADFDRVPGLTRFAPA